ncbi:MAG: MFS transporter [Planctomycetota bacterium]
MPSSSRPLPPTVRALGWTSFFTDLSSEAIYPLLPGFVKGLGGTSLDIGLIDGVANAVAAVVRLPSGAVSDSIGRRPLVLLGYGVSSVVRPLMGLVTSPLGVLLVRAADRFGKGVRNAPRDALVADLVEPESRGRAFGHIRGLDHAGAAIGPLVAMAFLLVFPGAQRTLFLLTLLPGLATLAVIWRFVRDPPRHSTAPPALAGGLSRSQGWLLACVAIWATGAASEQFLLLRAEELGMPVAFIPPLWFAISLAKGVTATRAGHLADRISPRRALAGGWLVFAAAYGALALAPSLTTALPLLIAVGVGYGLAEPAERKLVAALAPTGRHGGAFGWYSLVQGLMALPAGLLAGTLWDTGPAGPSWAFAATAVLALAASGLLVVMPASPGARAMP